MKVYVLFKIEREDRGEYDWRHQYVLLGVYSTMEKAIAAREAHIVRWANITYRIETHTLDEKEKW